VNTKGFNIHICAYYSKRYPLSGCYNIV
jgi:hypothetical protein